MFLKSEFSDKVNYKVRIAIEFFSTFIRYDALILKDEITNALPKDEKTIQGNYVRNKVMKMVLRDLTFNMR